MCGIAMVLIFSTGIIKHTTKTLNHLTEFQRDLISVERLSNFEEIDWETGYVNFEQEEQKMIVLEKDSFDEKSNKVAYWRFAPPMVLQDPRIIKQGRISFRGVSARY